MKKLLVFLDKHLEMLICVPLVAVMSIVICGQVIMRYVFNNSLSWSDELGCYLFVWVSMIGCSYAVKGKKHMRVDALVNILPPKVGAVVDIIADLLFLIFAVIVFIYGIRTVDTFMKTGQMAAGIHIQTWWLYLSIVLGMFLTALRLIQSIVLTVRDRLIHSEEVSG